MGNVRAHIHVVGIVQGVWFRASAAKRAQELGDITGWVKNLPDGRVEVICEGSREKVEKLIEWLSIGSELAKVTDLQVAWGKAIGDLTPFSVHHE